jgi:hypothetical protein
MTNADVIRMAREAGFAIDGDWYGVQGEIATIERFANLVAAAEREECAKVCEVVEDGDLYFGNQYAAAIRERGAP